MRETATQITLFSVSMPIAMSVIKLSSSDGQVFEVPAEVARMSTTVNTLLNDLGIDENNEDETRHTEPIPLENVTGIMLKKVIEWCTKHKGEKPPEDPTDNRELPTDDIPQWDQDFFNVFTKTDLYDIIRAANYLEIKGLLDNACKTIAIMMKNKKVEQIRDEFGIVNDFTEQEEAKIRKENEWSAN